MSLLLILFLVLLVGAVFALWWWTRQTPPPSPGPSNTPAKAPLVVDETALLEPEIYLENQKYINLPQIVSTHTIKFYNTEKETKNDDILVLSNASSKEIVAQRTLNYAPNLIGNMRDQLLKDGYLNEKYILSLWRGTELLFSQTLQKDIQRIQFTSTEEKRDIIVLGDILLLRNIDNKLIEYLFYQSVYEPSSQQASFKTHSQSPNKSQGDLSFNDIHTLAKNNNMTIYLYTRFVDLVKAIV